MTDNMDKPSKHGLRRPPNDGAPQPKPPRPWPKAGPLPKVRCRCCKQVPEGGGWRDVVGFRRVGDAAIDWRWWARKDCPHCKGKGTA